MILQKSCGTSEPGARDPVYETCVPPATYQALHYHRPSSAFPDKSKWAISQDEECHTFCVSTDRDWTDDAGSRWYVDGSGEELGTARERVAKFPRPSNTRDPWHGYPVSGRTGSVATLPVPREILTTWDAQAAAPRSLLAKLWKRTA